ncbi:TSUP family transporter [Clostridium beijerinckii]|nr:TSUP family transporter [Clostridium beijerinckii]MZK52026.1 TSUP family transporter [Clostridium beijerinckii]MZK60167.1 TSUP family transporter [Clostridium beijerinckii]MZK70452.1 TSUP family transporter [Clostridium beijerinckii]MZK75754.1 TSUP family transporter [Clostridium beijerinckii]MZK85418.1 TSUP family transporter [Clostridium beijerinckii]
MIGNAAGPIFSVYLLATGFKKNDFMGTTAWFFFIINLFKLPLQILFWHNIPIKTIFLTFSMVPAIAIGAVLGVLIIKKLNEKLFRSIILAVTAIAAIRLFI